VNGNIKRLNKYNRKGVNTKKTLKAIQKLKEFGDKKAVEPLLWNLENAAYSNYYLPIIEALAEIGDERAINPLTTFLGKRNLWKNFLVDKCIIETLEKLDASNEQIGNAYLALLKEPYYNLKWVAQGLENIGDKRAIKPLIKHISSRSGFENFDIILKILFNLGATKEEIADEYLNKLIISIGWGLRYDAIIILGKLDEKRAIKPLIELSSNYTVNFVRDSQSDTEDIYNEFTIAISTLEKIGATKEEINDAYLNAVKNPDTIIRTEAFKFLIELHDNRAIEPLIQEGLEYDISGNNILHNTSRYYAALEKLGASKEQIIEVALNGLNGHSPSTRNESIEKLANLGTKDSIIQTIKTGLESGRFINFHFGHVIFEALEKLKATKEQEIEVAISGLMSNNNSIRIASINKLSSLQAKETIHHLTPFLKDNDEQVRQAANLAFLRLS